VCVFVDGCFWHGCPIHFHLPKTHNEWWKEKIEDNVHRDLRQTTQIINAGWIVIRFWEHEIDDYLTRCVRRLHRTVAQRSVNAT
jgi:DNA mismatch endonuclease (patch repair protein)